MTAIRISPRPGLFSITDYPNTTAGDDATGLRAAMDAAYLHGGGVIQLENRVYDLRSVATDAQGGAGAALLNRENSGVTIDIRGRGAGVTTVKLHNPVAQMIGNAITTENPVYSPISTYDFLLDCSTIRAVANQGALYHYGVAATSLTGFSTTGRTYVERVNADYLGHSVSLSRTVLKWNVNRAGVTNAQAEQTAYLHGLHVKDCVWGYGGGTSASRGAGNAGVFVCGFVNGTSSFTDLSKDSAGRFKASRLYGQIYNPANVIVDDILVENLRHTSGWGPVAANAPGAPIQLGGDGIVRWCHIRNLWCEQSGDIGIELDGCEQGIIEGCTFINGDGNQILLMPYGAGGGLPGNQDWDMVVRDCEMIYPSLDMYGNAMPGAPTGSAVSTNSRFGAYFNGRILLENITVKYDGLMDAGWNAYLIGPARETHVKNCAFIMRGQQTTTSINGLKVIATGRPQTVRVDGFRYDRKADVSQSVNETWFAVNAAVDLDLQIKGLSGSSSGAESSGSVHRNNRIIDLSFSASDETEDFSVDLLDADWLFESGESTNYTYDGTSPKTYTATLDLSTEQRAVYICTNSETGATCLIGKVKDGATYMKMITGAATSGYKAGIFAKRRDASNYLEGYIYDDGSFTYLCLDKVVAGVRASLLPAAGGTATGAVAGGNVVTDAITPITGVSAVGLKLPAQIATATTHYPSLVVIGDTITAELWQSAEPGHADTRPVGTGDAWCSATLSGTDVYKFGSRAVGETGFTQTPIDAAAKIGKAVHRRLAVLRGRIEGVNVGSLDAATGTASGVYYQPTFAARGRIDGQLELVSSDLRQLKSATGTVKDFDMIASSTAFSQNILRNRNQVVVPLADTAITFVSGTAWQNTTGCWGSATVQGGTVTKIELSKDGTNYRDAGTVAGSFRLAPNWYIKLTHTGAPTSYFVAED